VRTRTRGERALEEKIARLVEKVARLESGGSGAAPEGLGSAAAALADEFAAIRSLVPLGRVADLLGLHIASVYRWTGRGCRGVRLRYVQRGGTRCTSRNWLEAFFAELTAAGRAPPPPPDALGPASAVGATDRFAKRAAEAGGELDAAWGRPRKADRPRTPDR
jgi:hypothetical protein